MGKDWFLIAALSVLLGSVWADAQNCPDANEASTASSLHGVIVHHEELRQWLGLKLDRRACGQDEIQLVFLTSAKWREADAFRGCTATIVGKLYYSPTGYYSADMAVSDPKIKPDASCKSFPIKPDLTKAPRKPNLTTFFALILVDYRNKGQVKVSVWEDQKRKFELKPWQAYVDYMLTGGRDVMWFGCADGFSTANIVQTPKPQGAAADMIEKPWINEARPGVVLRDDTVNTVWFTCVKEPNHQ